MIDINYTFYAHISVLKIFPDHTEGSINMCNTVYVHYQSAH